MQFLLVHEVCQIMLLKGAISSSRSQRKTISVYQKTMCYGVGDHLDLKLVRWDITIHMTDPVGFLCEVRSACKSRDRLPVLGVELLLGPLCLIC